VLFPCDATCGLSLAAHGDPTPSYPNSSCEYLLPSTTHFAFGDAAVSTFIQKPVQHPISINLLQRFPTNMVGFLHLPCEIRNSVYEEALGSGRNIDFRDQDELVPFAVSKQVRDESASYFYQHNAVTVYAPAAATGTATILPPIIDRYLRFLRRLTINATVGRSTMPETRKAATAIAALAGVGAQFAELNIRIESSLSRILNSRVDDSVMGSNHAITLAIRTVLQSNVAKVIRIQLEGAWFAPGVAQTLKAAFSTQLEFVADDENGGKELIDASKPESKLERLLFGRYSNTHLPDLDFSNQDITDMSSGSDSGSSASTPSTLLSSCCSAFSDLDAFKVSSSGPGSDDKENEDRNDSVMGDNDTSEPFFSLDDIEEWSGEEEQGMGDEALDDMDDLDEDAEMEDVTQGDFDAFVHNQRELANEIANDEDITYMTNFAPDLLLSSHNLGHLV
jgi:hypothetical protein